MQGFDRTKLRHFVIENFLFGRADGLSDDDSFLEKGIIDSTGILELIAFIEQQYRIKVQDEELVPQNLDSIANIAGYIERKTGQAHAAA